MASRFFQSRLMLPLVLVGMLILSAISALLSTHDQAASPISNRSVYSMAPSGSRAWFLTLQKAGLPVKIWEKSFQELPELPGTSTMVIIEPYTVSKSSIIFGQKEINALLSWVAKGNTLILLDDFQRYGGEYLTRKLMDTYPQSRWASYRLGGTLLSGLSDLKISEAGLSNRLLNAYVSGSFSSHSAYRFKRVLSTSTKGRSVDALPEALLEDARQQPALVQMRYGQGRLVLGTAVDLVENSYLHNESNDNYQFLANLLALEKKPVFINEFVHGYTEITDLFAYYQQKTPLGLILMQLCIGFAFLLWLSFVRWKPAPMVVAVEDDSTPPSAGVTAFVQSVAGIYYRSHAASLALAPVLQQLEALLKKRFRISLDEESRLQHLLASLSSRYSGKEASPDAWLQDIKKARSAIGNQERLNHREVFRLSRQLTLIQDILQHESGTLTHHR